MMVSVDIDRHSGFCAGVIRAIGEAEKCLDSSGRLYSLGAIVHNDVELRRLEKKGLKTLESGELDRLGLPAGTKVLIRAHGEPPWTYERAEKLGLELIDCTCPVVLRLQKSIREAGGRLFEGGKEGQIVIFGKVGHAEVLGLVGQVYGKALVVENAAALEKYIEDGTLRADIPTEVFSQTTKSPLEYGEICRRLSEFAGERLTVHETICSQVALRHERLAEFAKSHDVIVFVSGLASSNGKVLCELCRSMNGRTHHIESPEGLKKEWFRDGDRVGVCGATSTPKWLLEQVEKEIIEYNNK